MEKTKVKSNKAKLWFVLVILFLIFGMLVIILSVKNNKKIQSSFYQPTLPYPINDDTIKINISDDKRDIFDNEVVLYKKKPIRTSNKEFDENILRTFGFDDDYVKVGNDGSTFYKKTNEREIITECIDIYKNGSFSYDRTADEDDRRVPFTESYEELGRKAEEFLKLHDFFPDGFFLSSKKGSRGTGYSEPGGEEVNIETARGVMFTRKIDGYDVRGTGKIIVEFDNRGILSASVLYSGCEEDRKITTISYDTAVERIRGMDDSSAAMEYDATIIKGEIKEAVINDVQMVYYDMVLENDIKYIYPCFIFSGTVTDELNNESLLEITIDAFSSE